MPYFVKRMRYFLRMLQNKSWWLGMGLATPRRKNKHFTENDIKGFDDSV
jgi:hypothetical protein